jgi:hypothetical protein
MRCHREGLRTLFPIVILITFLTACNSGMQSSEQQPHSDPQEHQQHQQPKENPTEVYNNPNMQQEPQTLSAPVSPPEGTDYTSQLTKKIGRNVKGVYVSAYALHGEKWSRIKHLLVNTELNALVIDVKNDSGRITYPSAVKAAQQIGADASVKVKDISPILSELKKRDTYTIARIVTFKDPFLAAKKPEWAMKTKAGKVWSDKRGVSWVDPYNEEVWDYSIQLAKEAIEKGFDEVQFDYVRFPEQVKTMDREVMFHNPKNESKDQIIARFLQTARKEIHAMGGIVSADVFGLTTTAHDGMGIGQKWEALVPEVDAISPMIYPSHYAKGSYGVRYPDLQPYTIVSEAAKDANAKNAKLKVSHGQVARIRPWIQDFTAKWVKPHQTYRRSDVLEQIKALEAQGIGQYLLWNASCNYSLQARS